MLHLKKVLGAKPKEHVHADLETLYTQWGQDLDPDDVLPEHPTPQFARPGFRILNGTWRCAFAPSGHAPDADLQAVVDAAPMPDDEAFNTPIVVPFSPEAPLSGVMRQLKPDELLWYRRDLPIGKPAEGARTLLHFQAVDFACAVYVNDVHVGGHAGGYIPFSLDVTDALQPQGNRVTVCVADASEFGGHVRGKQRFDRGDIWYTAQSGIWQTVWLEDVADAHIVSARIEADAQTGIVALAAQLDFGGREDAPPLTVEAFDAEGALVGSTTCTVGDPVQAAALLVKDARLWSPDDPYLYRLKMTFGQDEVESYCGFRTIERKRDAAGVSRLYLNGKPLFIRGVLDQAYWPDGLMTAPSDEALVFDISAMRDAGFNLMRKHIKVEAERWYYHCDRTGMLVLQDMVNGGGADLNYWHTSYKPTLFKFSWNHYRDDTEAHMRNLGAGDAAYRREWTDTCRQTVQALANHPCIIGWSLFNEGWGQFQARQACALVRREDPTRLVDAVSGWYDQRCGDFSSVHNYFRDMVVWPDRRSKRAFFISEFGGYTHRVEGHSSLPEAYGYEPYDDRGEWKQAVRKLIAEVEALEPKGLVGYVYTQVSDIEEETNGILTYDRRINKLD